MAGLSATGTYEKETSQPQEPRMVTREKEKLENYPLFFVNIPQVKAAGGKQKGSKTLRR